MAKITLLRIRHIALSTLLEPINMKKILLLCLLLSVCVAGFSKESPEGVVSLASQRKMEKKLSSLPVFTGLASTKTSYDWLVHPERSHAGIYASSDGKSLIIANGMLWRTFRLFPNLTTTDYVNRMTGERMLRAVSPEGTITLNGKQCSIGGLAGQPERGYLLPQWIDSMRTIPGSFVLEDFEIRDMQPTVSWHPVRWALNTEQASGKEVMFTLRGTGNFQDVTVRLHLGVYDYLPVIRKGLEIVNGGATAIRIDSLQFKKVVCDVIAWYKKYRTILNSDIIHLRKPDAQDWDGIMHVNPYCREKALALFFNPTDKEMVRTITLPLYYTGLEGKASIREREGSPVAYALDCDKNVTLQVKIPAGEYTWYVVE